MRTAGPSTARFARGQDDSLGFVVPTLFANNAKGWGTLFRADRCELQVHPLRASLGGRMTNQETLFIAQGGLRVDFGGATGWEPAGDERNGGEEDGHEGEGDDVVRADS